MSLGSENELHQHTSKVSSLAAEAVAATAATS